MALDRARPWRRPATARGHASSRLARLFGQNKKAGPPDCGGPASCPGSRLGGLMQNQERRFDIPRGRQVGLPLGVCRGRAPTDHPTRASDDGLAQPPNRNAKWPTNSAAKPVTLPIAAGGCSISERAKTTCPLEAAPSKAAVSNTARAWLAQACTGRDREPNACCPSVPPYLPTTLMPGGSALLHCS